jgi:hypothetical protein
MSDAAATVKPVYFELSWSILSSIGMINVLYGLLIVGITSLNPISAVPIVVSTAGALANGLCYYSAYGHYSPIPTVVAGVFADAFWLVSTCPFSELTSLMQMSGTRSWRIVLQLSNINTCAWSQREEVVPGLLLDDDNYHRLHPTHDPQQPRARQP